MDKINKEWLNGKQNFYFRYKYKIVEGLIEGSCLNIGCGEHIVKDALNVDYPEVDITNLPYSNNSFDTVLVCDILEHLENDDSIKGSLESLRVAKRKVVITVPAFQCLWSKYDEILGHKRRYKRRDKRDKYLFGALFPVFYLRKFTSGKTPNIPKWLDTIFYWLSHIRLPFGSTLLIEVIKNDIKEATSTKICKEL